MSYRKNTAVTGLTFLLVDTSGSAITGEAANISGYYTIDGGTQTAISGSFAEEGNGEYSIDLTAAEMNGDQIGLTFTHASAIPVHYHIKTTGGSTAISGESSLSVSLVDLKKEVGFYYLGEDTYSNLSAAEQGRVDRIIESGVRRFYVPPPLPGERKAHQWSFLQPITTLATVASTSSYNLPDDFGGMASGGMMYAAADARWHPIREVSMSELKKFQMRSHGTVTIWPVAYAIEASTTDGSDGQRFKVHLWPTPDKAYTLTYQYNVIQDALTDANPFPYGGMHHSETILAACLSVAEERMENARGVQYQNFIERLQSSVAHDREFKVPDTIGTDNDHSATYPFDYQEVLRRYSGSTVSYDGGTS